LINVNTSGFVENQSISEERQAAEEAIEENEEERIPHESFYSGILEETFLPEKFISNDRNTRFISSSASPTKMSVTPNRHLRGCIDVFLFILCLALVILQFGLLDFYYLTVLKDNIWYTWIGADSLVIVILIWLLVIVVRNNQQHMEDACSADAKVKYTWIGWFLYSVVLAGKVAVCFRLFYTQLPPVKTDSHDKILDDHLFRLGLSLSAPIFILLLESHHYTTVNSNRQLYLIYLMTSITFDLIDTVCFLDLLWQSFKNSWDLPFWLDLAILLLACINLILPVFTLIRLRFGRRLPRFALFSEKIWSLIYVLMVNAPYLGIRIYLYVLLEISANGKHYDASILMIKNVAMIYLAVRDVWTRLQYWRHKKNISGSRGELTAPGATNDDDN
uniref:Conserved plasma membrane protein n=1 Tax=Onchocerca flexuosa TaxID=387005 RepID=A0A183HZ35_9BILA